jgi:nitric oxide reductase subunit C
VIAAGGKLFQRHCASCHTLEPDVVIVGPSLAGIAGRAGERTAGLDARQYIQTSVLRPDAYVVEGFDNLMPSSLAKDLTGEELDTLTAYLLTLE